MNVNKNAVIGILVVVLVVMAGAFFIFRGDKALDVFGLDRDIAELDGVSADLDAFSKNNVAIEELNQTLNDILDETVGISATDALDESSLAQDASQADLSQTLNDFAADDAALSELDQGFGEVSQ